MIHINLLPKELIPKRRSVLPYVAVAGLAVILVVWVLVSFVGVVSQRSEKLARKDQLENELRSYDDAIAQVRLLEAEEGKLALKEEAIDEITAGRTVWSHEMWQLAHLVPDEIWLKELKIGDRRRAVQVEKPNPNRSRGAPPTITTTEIRSFPALVVTGYALSPYREEGVRLVGELITNMKQNEEFSTRFVEPEMRTIERKDFEGHTVMQFVMDVEMR